MKKRRSDFSKGKRGPVVAAKEETSRIAIRIDDAILDWFRTQADAAGGGNYQTMINDALRRHIANVEVERINAVRVH